MPVFTLLFASHLREFLEPPHVRQLQESSVVKCPLRGAYFVLIEHQIVVISCKIVTCDRELSSRTQKNKFIFLI